MNNATATPAPPSAAPQAAPPPASIPWRDSKEKGMPATGYGILAGPTKGGKTTLMADFPGAVILELDKGDADHVPGRILDVDDVRDAAGALAVAGEDAEGRPVYKTKLWVFRQTFKAQVADPSVKVIGIDMLNTLASWFADEVAQSHGVEHINTREKGVDGRAMWGEFKVKMERFIAYVKGCGKFVVFGSHLRPPDKDDAGKVIAPAKLDVAGSSADFIARQAKFIGYCYKEERGSAQAYYVSFRGGPLAELGSRIKELNDKTLVLPAENPYSAILAALKAKPEGAPAAAEAAAPTTPGKAAGKGAKK